ncbi:Putative secreted protein [Streptomyces venezuelae]|uniref:hypothetical protein n=1 Tax=Streptomyces gardneri TaxID=66892 RepID=UPI0006BDA230|nr:hypothetical protein [Streptomyces gardneri]ALO12863.1 Putative secreted protein [Streptomyces venezuelae]QPK49571.1 hypothetical protein H4W23_36520 [Streptomyces gardneri]WRK41115.1 hypothetical protein U0M97_36740 [Streptomyces venezuelae]CUM36479.1 hypothetical protein BN2537_1923 [Streptomyces venezuelae]
MTDVESRDVTKPTLTEDEKRLRIRRSTVGGGILGGVVGAAAPFVTSASLGIAWLFEHLASAGALTAALSCAVGVWLGVRGGRTHGSRNAALERGETVLSEYAVRPPVVDGRATKPSEVDRWELRVTDRHLQLWDARDRLWSHPWHEIRLTTVKGGLLLVHRPDQVVAELLPVPESIGWDALLLGARRLQGRSRDR